MTTTKKATTKKAPEKILTAADFFEAPKKLRRVELLGGIVYVRDLTAGEVVDFMRKSETERVDQLLVLIAASVVDNDGNSVFKPNDAERLKSVSVATYNTLAGAVLDQITGAEGSDTEGEG